MLQSMIVKLFLVYFLNSFLIASGLSTCLWGEREKILRGKKCGMRKKMSMKNIFPLGVLL